MRFLPITFTRIYKRFVNRRPPEFGLEAILFHGAVKDSYLTLRRLLKCHLLNVGGINLFQNNLVDNNG